jgi:2-polyprenyl-3-methyl-5-hydroxy-6-metoxy-1,4-benzoquinol methylase
MLSPDNGLTPEQVAQQRDTFVERLLRSTAGAFDIFTVYIGDRLGLYHTLAANGSLTAAELAAQTGCQERYAREWLEQQTVVGILEVENETSPSGARRFRLPPGHVEPLTDQDSLNYLAPLAQLFVGVTRPITAVADAFCAGGGVPLDHYGDDFRMGQAKINRPMYLRLMGTEWLPALPDTHHRLRSDPPARVADIGCGAGWSSIGIAEAYPSVLVDGYDLDGPSIELARANARAHGLTDRVRFHARDAGDPSLEGHYDLVIAFECIHDMSDPVSVLGAMRKLAGESGTVMVVDERVGDTFTATGNDVEWMMYGWSVLHCLPVGMADQPSAGTGTVMRTDTLRHYAREAGFRDVEVLPIDNFFFRFYRLMS